MEERTVVRLISSMEACVSVNLYKLACGGERMGMQHTVSAACRATHFPSRATTLQR